MKRNHRGILQRRMDRPLLFISQIAAGIACLLLAFFVFYPYRYATLSLLSGLKAGPKAFRAKIPEEILIAQNMFRGKIPVVDQPVKPPTKVENLPSVEKIVAPGQPFVPSPERKEPTQETEFFQTLDIQTIIETTPGLTTEWPTQSADTLSEKNELQQEIDPSTPVEPQTNIEMVLPAEEPSVSSQSIFATTEQIKPPEIIDLRQAEIGLQAVKDDVVEKNQERKIHREKWLLSQGSSNYTIQLMGARKEVLLHDFVKRNQLLNQNEIALYQTTFKDKAWFQLLYGVYATKKDAQAAADNLPLNIRKASPWIRRLSAVQKAIRSRM